LDNAFKQQLQTLLGETIAAKPDCAYRLKSSTAGDKYNIQNLLIDSKDGEIPATLLAPITPRPDSPAILYCHAHGNNYSIGKAELLEGRPALQDTAYGPLLAQLGCNVLCLDMPCFGDRQQQITEAELARQYLWEGKTLFGKMLAELTVGLDFLEHNLSTKPAKIATMGISMGATHAYWLAALDDRVSAVAHLCAFSNISALIALNAHTLHGPYMTIPGFLAHFDMADIAAAIAPRAQLIGSGLKDPLTPAQALFPALQQVSIAYQNTPQNLTVINEPLSGHKESAKMRQAVIEFLLESLGQR